MWWKRGRGSALGRPIPRGARQDVPPYLLVPLVAAIAVLGCFVPLLGMPLLALLAATRAVVTPAAERQPAGRSARPALLDHELPASGGLREWRKGRPEPCAGLAPRQSSKGRNRA
ncbi:hypothetical protein TU94_03305 [Streptomyces cyaneogriseus subsp. noncyanogenus]|uniref:Uncharacterized protein n=1 Tax=Streptomyces cyaneogriseus subsp. noncyanogenus TaxID=477245 RepID=A0A0C5FSM6_9ACTN|nr:hypothetical protein TU94_03305 [Streptomyces cyaneogriseus subsp. noncyanogenus]